MLPPVARGGCFSVVVSPLLALASDQARAPPPRMRARAGAPRPPVGVGLPQPSAWPTVAAAPVRACGAAPGASPAARSRRLHLHRRRRRRRRQVEHCLEAGVEAAAWNWGCSDQQRRNVLSELAAAEPELRLLYTTPESLLKPALRDALKARRRRGGGARAPWG
jgi:hypothetical protein